MHPVGSPRFGSVFPLRIKLENPDEQLPNRLRKNPEIPERDRAYFTPWEYNRPAFMIVAGIVLRFLTGERPDKPYIIPEPVQKRLQMKLAELDPEYRPGDRAMVGNALWNLLDDEVLDEDWGGLLLITGERDCDTFRKMQKEYILAGCKYTQAGYEVHLARGQWVKERIAASGKKLMTLTGIVPPQSADPMDEVLPVDWSKGKTVRL